MQFDPGIRYQCLQCGKSCRQDWNIWVRPELPAVVRKDYREIFSGPAFPFEAVDGRWRMTRSSTGCVSLDSHSRCKIHSALSYAEKPYRCQQYPILLVKTPDGVRVSASFTCTAVLQGHGPELAQHAPEVANWLEGPFFMTEVGEGMPWEDLVSQERHFDELLAADGWELSLRRILSGLASGWQDRRSDHPARWWKHYRGANVDLESCLPWLLAALLKPCLHLRDKQRWQHLDLALLQKDSVYLEEFDYYGGVEELSAWALDHSKPSPDLDRYRQSLRFRQQHLRCGGNLSGWLMLWSVGPLYRVLRELGGSHDALERIELNLLGHTSLGEQIFPPLAQFWLDGQSALVAP